MSYEANTGAPIFTGTALSSQLTFSGTEDYYALFEKRASDGT